MNAAPSNAHVIQSREGTLSEWSIRLRRRRRGGGWRECGHCRSGRTAKCSKVNRRRTLRTWLRVEERPLLKAEQLVKHVGREPLDRGVVLLDCTVEIIPFHRDPVLGAFELSLQILECFGRAQLRI